MSTLCPSVPRYLQASSWLSRSAAPQLYGPVKAPRRSVRFNLFVGNWTGAGEVIGSNGQRERIRCRADYEESMRGEALSQTIVCASPSYRIDIQSTVEAPGGRVQGRWSEATRGVSGQLSGTVQRGLFEGAVYGPGFTAGVSLRSNGRRQAVNIQPSPGGDIADVQIELERRS
jgi:hypothetical protein